MPLVVYIDLIFLMNLLIDASLLLVTAWMRKQKVVLWRLALSAVVGAMYVVMMFLPELSFLYTFLVKFLFSVVMLWVAFGFGSLQNYLRNMGAFYIVNFAAAGGILGVHYLLQDSGEIWSGIWYSASGGLSFSLKIGVLFILVCFFAVLYGFKRVIDARQRQERIRSFLADLEVRVGDTAITCTGLIDTGNQLSDPLSRLPVTVMEAVLWEQVLPPSYRGKLADERADNLILQLTEAGDFPWPERLRLVPYRGINKGTQFMLALKPDEVTVRLDGKEYRSSRVLIGLDGGRLSTEGTYQAIVHPALVESTEAKESMDTISKTGT
ncbi:sigma-E processing peptidase SpoIIGA [Paenibacillus barengoltzii]|jgi:stage II sporulation protein GA (sporulation sigma-E factor processing peptidase)|uniref:sigma-E processing peptidase SpoIIGA n=1 Tax=Paenibacillus barengoltzii TaxID=343517 RepID=UPI000A08D206|nr:sigma-E processing peptidase SpoIIGA [Paenibacillus barengoltzii]SMF07383.1 stage II sporulation protein GA (sporulation sigma-E factor processing peptidase) [Paenibacillus barengoltzii]